MLLYYYSHPNMLSKHFEIGKCTTSKIILHPIIPFQDIHFKVPFINQN